MNNMSKMKVLVLVPIGGGWRIDFMQYHQLYHFVKCMGSGFMSFGLKIGGWGLTFILY